MFRFGISEYIRNWWFNLCVVLIMVVMMLISTIFISNIEEETKIYRLANKYIDEDSIFALEIFSDFFVLLLLFSKKSMASWLVKP